jgi:tetratricopeptide (TPR) repeat protein
VHELKRLVDSGQYLAAIRRFEERLGSGELGAADLALGYHFVSVAHFGTRDVFRAQMFAEKAAGLAGKIGDVQTQLRAWSNLVEYARNLGDYGLAVEYGDKWLGNIHRCPGEAVRQGRVHYNLGLVYRHRKDPEEALRHFKAALETLPENQTEFRLMVLLMTAWLCYEIRRIDEADRFAADAGALLEGDDVSMHLRREHLLLRAWRAYHTGDHQVCIPLCEEFLQGAATEPQKFWAAGMITSCALQLYPDEGQLLQDLKRAAIFYTDLCGQLALSLKEPRLINFYTNLRQRVKARWADYLAG